MIEDRSNDYRELVAPIFLPWGKAEKDGTKWEPAILHMLTVGVVAKEVYRALPRRVRKTIARGFGMRKESFAAILPIIASLHDIGKISPGHQHLREDLPCVAQIKDLGFSFLRNRELNHKHVAFSYIKEALDHIALCTPGDGSSACISYALAAHHGQLWAVDNDRIDDDERWSALRISIAECISSAFGHDDKTQLKAVSLSSLLLLSGLTVLADWIGSSVEFFPYTSVTGLDEIPSFIGFCKNKASRAISYLGLNARLAREFTFESAFGGKTPNAAQQVAFGVAAELTHPMLLIVLSSTGSGKTEIPLGMFAKSAIREDLRGLFFALPTQGTANQNFQRLSNFGDGLSFEGNPQLHLLHSVAEIDETYSKLKTRVDDGANEESGSITASEWFSTTKKGLAATFGGGTIDQALLSVLRVKWMTLRFFALAGKLIVLDEIHSYDTYMTRSISRFLEWVPYIETSVVALSATLPQNAVKDLLKSFSPEAELPDVIPYPCVVGVDKTSAVRLSRIPVDDFRANATLLPFVVDAHVPLKTIIHKIEEVLPERGNIAVIMNSIGEAQDLARLIQGSEKLRSIQLLVYHSRFTVSDRANIESKIKRRYGKEGFTNGERPLRSIIIATQVLEQSLDVDFDLMISWLAPIDLLLQRLGRLQRFSKWYPRSADRVLHVAMTDILPGNIQFGVSGIVYFPDILEKTAKLFVKSGEYQCLPLNLPESASPLIEAVYSKQEEDELTKWERDRIGKQLGEIYLAEENLLNQAHGDDGDEANPLSIASCLREALDESKVSSRLADVSVTVVLLSPEHRPTPTDGQVDTTRALWNKSMPIRNRGLVTELLKITPPSEWENIPLLSNSRALCLEKKRRFGRYEVSYSDVLGLQISRTKKGE
jgi:CRISPR-associated endonuclease/helicase Cas3